MPAIAELMDLSGRVAVITGGAGRLGSTFARTLAELGCDTVLLDITEERLMAVAEDVSTNSGRRCLAVPIDITDEAAVARVFEGIGDEFGKIDVLVNNAAYPPGIEPPDGLALSKQTLSRWSGSLEVILDGAFLVTRGAESLLRQSPSAAVINIASIYGHLGPDFRVYDGTNMANDAFYAAGKGGIIQLTRYLATLFAPGIRVNCIAPGGIETDQPESFKKAYRERTPLGRMATPDDLRGALVYLASDLSAYVTGQILLVDGGWSAW